MNLACPANGCVRKYQMDILCPPGECRLLNTPKYLEKPYRFVVEFDFSPGDKVHLDGDETLTMAIVSCAAHVGYNLYELSWLNGGSPAALWANGVRLTKAKI